MSDTHDCLWDSPSGEYAESPQLSPAAAQSAEARPVYSYPNAASCPDCGAGMIRLGTCLSCPLCGFGACG